MDLQQEFESRDDVFRWMDGFINMERGQSSKSFRLDRMELVACALCNARRRNPGSGAQCLGHGGLDRAQGVGGQSVAVVG